MTIKQGKKGYIIHKTSDQDFQLCKILKEYNTLEAVETDLINLLAGNKSEKQLIKENSKG